jgi:hypothetical protein
MYNNQTQQLPVKVIFSNGEVIRFKSNYPTYLKKILGECFQRLEDEKVKNSEKFKVTYQDVDGDWVNLDTEEDFIECLSHSLGPSLKLKIERNNFFS